MSGGIVLQDRLAAVNRMQVERLTDLGAGFEPGPAQDAIVAQFERAAKANAEAGAEVVIAAGGVVMALLAHAGIHEAAGMPILNGITNLVKLGEMAVKTNRLMGGRFTSKRCTYAAPPVRADWRIPQALWGGYLSDREGELMLRPAHRSGQVAAGSRAEGRHGDVRIGSGSTLSRWIRSRVRFAARRAGWNSICARSR